jgi:hypothetical protein
MRALEVERLKRFEKILEIKKQIEEEERNAIETDEEPVHEEPKEILYENDVLGMVYITASELQSLVSQRKYIVHNFVYFVNNIFYIYLFY